MKAAVLRAYKEPLQVEELAVESPHVGEIAIKVAAAGVCHSDLYVLEGATPVPPPLVPGHEAVGVVEEVGPGVDGVSPGDHVVTSFIWPCGRCKNCTSGRENLCENFAKVRLKGTLLDGTTRLRDGGGGEVRIFLGGTWAERAVIPATAAAKIPRRLAKPEMAMLGCAFLTAYGAVVNTGSAGPGDTVVVIGTGGVGLAAVQVAKAVGARVVAVGRNPAKLAVAREMGAETVDVHGGDPVKAVQELTEGRGADVVIEAVEHVLGKIREGKKLSTEDVLVLYLGTIVGDLKEIRADIARLDSRIDETNKRIDQTNQRIDDIARTLSARIDETNKRIDETSQRIDDAVKILSTRIDEVAKSLSARIDETNKRIDEISRSVSARIDETNKRIDDLARSLSARIDETNKRIDETNKRIDDLAKRVDELAKRIDAVQTTLLEIQKLLLELVKTRQPAP